MLSDRDYIQDNIGNFLKVIGNHHLPGKIVSYIKYFPSKFGNRQIKGQYYGYNSFVSKSFTILCNDISRVCYSEHHGGIVTCTPEDKIHKIYYCRSKLQEIYKSKDKYIHHPVGQELINFLQSVTTITDIKM